MSTEFDFFFRSGLENQHHDLLDRCVSSVSNQHLLQLCWNPRLFCIPAGFGSFSSSSRWLGTFVGISTN